jgi:hypothetical protein
VTSKDSSEKMKVKERKQGLLSQHKEDLVNCVNQKSSYKSRGRNK